VLVGVVEHVGAAGEQAGVLRVPCAHWRWQVLSIHLVNRGACAFDLGVPVELEIMACEQRHQLPLYFFAFALNLEVPFLRAPLNLEDLKGRLLKHLLNFIKLRLTLLFFLVLFQHLYFASLDLTFVLLLTQLPHLRGLHLHFAPLRAVQVLVCFLEVFQVEVLLPDPFVSYFFEPLVVGVPCYLAQPLEHVDCSLVLSLFLQRLTQVHQRPHLS
jgi:hypothetical protein